MSGWLPLTIARRFRKAKQRNRFISFISASSTLGIGLGVAVLILILSVMNGFDQALRNELLSVVPHIEYRAVEPPLRDWQTLRTDLAQREGVEAAAPFISFNAMLERHNQLKAASVRGIDLDEELQVSAIERYLLPEPAATLVDNDIWLGAGLAAALQLAVGDTVLVMVPKMNSSGRWQAPSKRLMTVKRLIKMGGQLDEALAMISLDTAREMVGWQQGVQGIRLMVTDVMEAPTLSRRIGFSLDQYLYIDDWTRSQGHLYQDIQLVRSIVYLVLSLVIAVASFNIVSTLVMEVQDKQGEIAILQTMGAKPSTIMAIFVFQGSLNGVLGAVAGAVVGVLLCKLLPLLSQLLEQIRGQKLLDGEIYFIDHLPVLIQPSDVAIAVAVAICASVLATLYPAWRATRVAPATVLGHCN